MSARAKGKGQEGKSVVNSNSGTFFFFFFFFSGTRKFVEVINRRTRVITVTRHISFVSFLSFLIALPCFLSFLFLSFFSFFSLSQRRISPFLCYLQTFISLLSFTVPSLTIMHLAKEYLKHQREKQGERAQTGWESGARRGEERRREKEKKERKKKEKELLQTPKTMNTRASVTTSVTGTTAMVYS